MLNAWWRLRRLAAMGMVVSLAGCASMSEQECLTADWYEQGMREAQRGLPRSHIEEDRQACAKVGVVPDAARYFLGWSAGIRHYCTPENGERVGLDGGYYRNSCPAAIEPGFLERYRAGKRVYDARQSVERLRSQQYSKQSELDRAKDDSARRRLRADLRNLDRRLRDARDDLHYAERRLRR